MSNLDLSENTELISLFCNKTNLTNLDLSNNKALTSLLCSNSNLNRINLKNGNYRNLVVFDVTLNPNLTCIEVDSTIHFNTFWIDFKDAGASYKKDCSFAESKQNALLKK